MSYLDTAAAQGRVPGLSYLQDTLGGVSTYLSITAGITGMIAWTQSTDRNGYWLAPWATALAWSGIIEIAAIALVIITNSDILRAIGGFSMVGVNSTCLILLWQAFSQAPASMPNWLFPTAFVLHGIALGDAVAVFLNTFIVNTKTGAFRMFNPLN